MGIKIYKALCDTTLNGVFVKKGTEMPFSTEPKNVNFKFVREDGTKIEKVTNTTTIKK